MMANQQEIPGPRLLAQCSTQAPWSSRVGEEPDTGSKSSRKTLECPKEPRIVLFQKCLLFWVPDTQTPGLQLPEAHCTCRPPWPRQGSPRRPSWPGTLGHAPPLITPSFSDLDSGLALLYLSAQQGPSHVLFHTDADGSRVSQLKASPIRLHHLLRPHNYSKARCSLTQRGEFTQSCNVTQA